MEVVYDTFISNIFKRKIGNLIGLTDNTPLDLIDKIYQFALKEKYSCLISKVDINNIYLMNKMIKSGFDLVNTQVQFKLSTDVNIKVEERETVKFAKYDKEDEKEIANIAKVAFKEDQFHLDNALDNRCCDKYYEEWAKNSCNGYTDDVFVLKMKNMTIGFLTLRYIDKYVAVVELAAISPLYQGNGLFHFFIAKVLDYLKEKKFTTLLYGTQLGNYPVLCTMAKFAGKIISCKYVLHLNL